MFKHSISAMLFVATLTQVCFVPASVRAQSENYGNPELLPGEQVVTPTGQTIKVWSTEGPLRVSPPPQPFDDPSKQHLNSAGVVIDDRLTNRRDSSPRKTQQEKTQQGDRASPDSFDLKKYPK